MNFPVFKELKKKTFVSYKKLANFIRKIFKFFNLLENETSHSIDQFHY